jgi:hypothetical protein
MPTVESVHSALEVLQMLAADGPTHPVSVRTAEDPEAGDPGDPVYYLDLADPDWRAVRISRAGWEVVDDPPVRFRRASGMLPLPEPVPGGSLHDLKRFVNVSDEDWPLYFAFLLAAARPHGPYPILAISGEQGAAKSTTSRVTRRLIDPNSCPLRAAPKEERDLVIAASNSWMLCYDNLSHLTDGLSDALCRLATGGGLATRKLHTDDEEALFDVQRPIMVNGIDDLSGRGDLLDRSLLIDLPQISAGRRREDHALRREFEEAHPRLLGALLDAVVGALRQLPVTEIDELPRMADFARWGEAGCRALGVASRVFLTAYEDNRATAVELALESSPAAQAVVALMAGEPSWSGSPQELLNALEERTESSRRRNNWPKSPRGLAGALKRAAPGLRAHGIVFHTGRGSDHMRTRNITLERTQP